MSETINFGASHLIYILQIDEDANDVSAQFDNNKIAANLPSGEARKWTQTESVGLAGE